MADKIDGSGEDRVSLLLAGTAQREILLGLMAEYYRFDGLDFDREAASRTLAPLLGDSSLGRAWLIGKAQDIAGYLVITFGYSLEFHGRYAYVDELYLREAFRGSGIGSHALLLAEGEALALGVRSLHLEVADSNSIAQSFYRKLGFASERRHLMFKKL